MIDFVGQGFPPEAPTRGGQARLPRAGTVSGMYPIIYIIAEIVMLNKVI